MATHHWTYKVYPKEHSGSISQEMTTGYEIDFFIEISSQEHEYSQLYDILRNHLNENVAANVQIDDIFSVDRIYSAIEDHKEAAKNTLIAVQFKEYIKLSNLPNSD